MRPSETTKRNDKVGLLQEHIMEAVRATDDDTNIFNSIVLPISQFGGKFATRNIFSPFIQSDDLRPLRAIIEKELCFASL